MGHYYEHPVYKLFPNASLQKAGSSDEEEENEDSDLFGESDKDEDEVRTVNN